MTRVLLPRNPLVPPWEPGRRRAARGGREHPTVARIGRPALLSRDPQGSAFPPRSPAGRG